MSKRKVVLSLLVVATIPLSVAAWQRVRMPALPGIAAIDMQEVNVRNQDIALFEARAKADPFSAADRARLASLYFQRSRETGDFEDYRRAEHTARASLELRTQRNSGALLILSSSLLAQHRFTDARVVAEKLVAANPDKPSARSLLGEIQLELGDYEAAGETFRSLRMHRYDLAVLPRYARWAEITGRTKEAGELLDRARMEARGRGDLPREQVTWFYLRAADFDMRHGNLREAERALRAGLAIEPADHRLWGMLSQLGMLRGDAEAAIAFGKRAGERADFTTLSAMAEAYRRLGAIERAQEIHASIEAQAAAEPEPFARQWTQHRLDNDVELEETVVLLGAEVAQRPDALGWDMYGWGLYKLGRAQEARAALQRALAPGIQDARFYFHAAAIERALGSEKEADRLLARARKINSRMVDRFNQRQRDRAAPAHRHATA
jgi:tetratricopeptide (TPR) repeat protein